MDHDDPRVYASIVQTVREGDFKYEAQEELLVNLALIFWEFTSGLDGEDIELSRDEAIELLGDEDMSEWLGPDTPRP